MKIEGVSLLYDVADLKSLYLRFPNFDSARLEFNAPWYYIRYVHDETAEDKEQLHTNIGPFPFGVTTQCDDGESELQLHTDIGPFPVGVYNTYCDDGESEFLGNTCS